MRVDGQFKLRPYIVCNSRVKGEDNKKYKCNNIVATKFECYCGKEEYNFEYKQKWCHLCRKANSFKCDMCGEKAFAHLFKGEVVTDVCPECIKISNATSFFFKSSDGAGHVLTIREDPQEGVAKNGGAFYESGGLDFIVHMISLKPTPVTKKYVDNDNDGDVESKDEDETKKYVDNDNDGDVENKDEDDTK